MHKLFGLNFEDGSKIDFQDVNDPDVVRLLGMNVVLIDEGAMQDDCFRANIFSASSLVAA